jgi:hypothetical protein
MTIRRISTYLILAVLTSWLTSEVLMSTPRIIPTPQSMTTKKGVFNISKTTVLVIWDDSKESRFAAQQFNERLKELKRPTLKIMVLKKLPPARDYIYIGSGTTPFEQSLLKERTGSQKLEERADSYILDANTKGVIILASSAAARFYGVMTLNQLLSEEKGSVSVPGVTIRDYPLQSLRGITDDISRGQVSTMENFKKIIRTMARYKMNVYCPYIEDMFVFRNHPLIGQGRGALTAAEFKELDAYAKQYFVEMIPIFETLGHWENILVKPEYVGYGEFPGAHTVNISDERVYTMLDEMIKELSGTFSSAFFNMAADESWDVGLGANKERVAKSDIATVHSEHYKRVVDMIRKYGKKPQMYGDIILNNPTILDQIPKDIVIIDWHYGASYSYNSPEVFQKAGFPYVVSPAVFNFVGPFPYHFNAFSNIQNFNREGYNHGSLGLLTSNWNDHGGEDLRELNYYGYAWTAECAWQPLKANVEEFDKAFFRDFFDGDEERMQTIYLLLSGSSNLISWAELWRHPFLRLNDGQQGDARRSYAVKTQSILTTMPAVLEQLHKAEAGVKREKDHLKILTFVAKLNTWCAQKIETSERIKMIARDVAERGYDTVKATAEIETLAKPIIASLLTLKKEFRTLWLRTCRPEGLSLLEARYDRQAAYWQETIDQVKKGNFDLNPAIASKWIYHPNGTQDLKTNGPSSQAFFRTTVKIDEPVQIAKIQLMGDTYAKLYVNGNFAGEIYARRSLSLIVDNERIKIFDVTPFLAQGINTLAVETQNFQPRGFAGANIYGEINLKSGKTQVVLSDSTWQVSETPTTNWQMNEHINVAADSVWTTAAARWYSSEIVKPNFSTKRTSWFEW